MNQQERRLYLIRELLQETQEPSLTIPTDFLAQKQLLRGLMNIRPPRPISQSFLRIQDAYLQEEQRKKVSSLLIRFLRYSPASICGAATLRPCRAMLSSTLPTAG